jgi:exportin-2 (importin alpha re-exporter)
MVCLRVFVTDLNKVSGDIDRKIAAIGMTKILCETQALQEPPYNAHWQPMVQALIELFELPVDQTSTEGADTFIEAEDGGYQVAYSQLSFASTKREDPCSDIPDAKRYFMERLTQTSPQVKSMLQQMPQNHQAALQNYSRQLGINIF